MKKCLILIALLATLTSGTANAQGMGNWVRRHDMELGQSARRGAYAFPHRGSWGGGYGRFYHPNYGRPGVNPAAIVVPLLGMLGTAMIASQHQQYAAPRPDPQMLMLQARARYKSIAEAKYPQHDSGRIASLGGHKLFWYPEPEYQTQGPAYLWFLDEQFFVEVRGDKYPALYEMLRSEDPAQIQVIWHELRVLAVREGVLPPSAIQSDPTQYEEGE